MVARGRWALAALLFWAAAGASAYDGPVEKKVFTLPTYTTVGGKTIKNVRVGYETYGTLNAAGDNAIFIPHFFTGTSHAAGKYKPADAAPGYWDPIIGAGKSIDTDKYFVISADALANLNTKDPNVTTTGPASVNPETSKTYGMSFPVVSYRDSVRVHKALVDSLGVKKLKAVAGASGGSIQAMEWGALYPDLVERVIHVKTGAARAGTADANSMIYTAKANQLFNLGDEVKKMKAKILFVPAKSDLIFPPELSQRAAERYRAQGGVAEVVVIDGDGGHLDGVLNVAKQGEAIRTFLAR
jgi:homoserine acetyltransferase